MSGASLGQMRHRITLMREVYDKGAGGRLVLTTPIIADVWASIDDSAESQTEQADQQKSTSVLTVRTRYRRSLMAAGRALICGCHFRITSKQKRGLLNPVIEMQLRSLSNENGEAS